MRAVDFYAGIGGWALGLKAAGIEVVRSYEWWSPAVETHRANLSGEVVQTDIRKLDLGELPDDIDVVVGSPPCTQFSYSNRGGSGDIDDGLRDIECFLTAVRHLRPKYWVLENVPRVAKVIHEVSNDAKSRLFRFQDILEDASIIVVDASDFGTPQSRRRCLVGNLNFDYLQILKDSTSRITLGDVCQGLTRGLDPVYQNNEIDGITDNEYEPFLSEEEARFNYEMKAHHPVYNDMSFPDRLDRPARTVTSTCTRVSRESIIIEEPGNERRFRRLSVRERASLQGFPANYQLHGRTHAEKLKMIGNAIPPTLSYCIAAAIRSSEVGTLPPQDELNFREIIIPSQPPRTSPDTVGRSYPQSRRFRFAIPNLRFKSGTRFELDNSTQSLRWRIRFFCGDSKRISEIFFSWEEILEISAAHNQRLNADLIDAKKRIVESLPYVDSEELQKAWAHKKNDSRIKPFELIDCLGVIAESLCDHPMCSHDESEISDVIMSLVFGEGVESAVGARKIKAYAKQILVGACIQATFNEWGWLIADDKEAA